jgi:hypothetical protein
MFAKEEWDLLVKLPRWVVRAASASQPDNARRTMIETEAGFLSVAEGRTLGSDLVKDIAQDTMGVFDDKRGLPESAGISFEDLDSGMTAVIERAQAALALMENRAPDDAAAYRRWLLAISDTVIAAARSHGVLGVGGTYVTDLEKGFDHRLEQALGS